MKILRQNIFFTFLILSCTSLLAQTAEEIINTYVENIGGREAWESLQATLIKGTVNEDGMVIPVSLYNTQEGKMLVIIDLQGQIMPYAGFDGENYWEMNFNTMSPEKADNESSTNMQLDSNDFPNPLINYKKNEYKAEYVETLTKEGTETYKVKLELEPITVNGVSIPVVHYYYFDTENYVPIVLEATNPSGQVSTETFSDYQKVDGLYFPFSFSVLGRKIAVDEIILNPEVNDKMFEFPSGK